MRISDWSSDVCSSDLDLAQFLPHHEFDRTIARLSCAGQHLQAVGKQIVIQGWRLVLADQQPVDVDDESAPRSQVLPALKQGLSCQVTGVDLKALKTLPPRPFTQGELVKAMKSVASSEERRVGKECVRTCRSRGSP